MRPVWRLPLTRNIPLIAFYSSMPKAKFYAVKVGRKPGIYHTWEECEEQVRGFAGAKFKSFNTLPEANLFCGSVSSNTTTLNQVTTLVQSVPATPSSSTVSSNVPFAMLSQAMQSTTTSTAPLPSKSLSLHSIRTQPYRPRSPTRTSPKRPKIFTTPSKSPPPSGPRADALRAKLISGAAPRDKMPQIVYTDGSCVSNGKLNARAGLGVFWGDGDARNLSERVPGKQTNNRAEILAVIRALEQTRGASRPLEVRTDSRYVIQCVTSWIFSWWTKCWTTAQGTPVLNKDLLERLVQLCLARQEGAEVYVKHVRAHRGLYGNESADQLAKAGGRLVLLSDTVEMKN